MIRELPGRVLVLSSVAGGPILRLARHLGPDAQLRGAFDGLAWRRRVVAGRLPRFAARLQTFLAFPARELARAVALRPAAILATTNPFVLPWLAVATRPLHGARVVVLVYDLYPDVVARRGLGVLVDLLHDLQRRSLHAADAVVYISRATADAAHARYGAPARWEVIPTGADPTELADAALGDPTAETNLERWCDDHLTLAYVGNLGHVHDWRTLADAAPALLQDRPDLGIAVAASGPGVAWLRSRWAGLSGDRVRFEAPLPQRPWARLLRRCPIALVTLRADAAHTSVPSKVFTAMAARQAIVAVAPPDSDLARLIEDHGCGRVVAPGDVTGLCEAVTVLVDDPAALAEARDRAYAAACEEYDVAILAERWRDVLADACGVPRTARAGRGRPAMRVVSG